MYTARPSRPLIRIISAYFERRAHGTFHAIRVRGLDRLRPWSIDAPPDGDGIGPLIIVANHTSWWDAAMPIIISHRILGHDVYAMMTLPEVVAHPFFRRVGAFSIDRENPRSAMRSIDYAAGLMAGRRRVIWIYPQGEIVHGESRPIRCQSGAARLAARIAPCTIIPVAFRYELFREERPGGWISVGEPFRLPAGERINARELNREIERALTAEVDRLRDDILAERTEEFELLLKGRISINRQWRRAKRIARRITGRGE